MKRNLAIALTLALAAFAASADKFAPAQGSLIRVEGTSTLHAWKMEGSMIQGQIDASSLEAATVKVSIPVTSIKSEHAKMDKLMAEALKAKANPEIRYELTQATIAERTADAFSLKTRGKLTIAGVTRDIEMTVAGQRNPDGRYELTGTAPIKMTDYGIKPPTAMLNTIKTGNDVTVTFRWIVQEAK